MFFKYLVDKKHVTVEQLLLGVAMQMESMPCFLRVVLKSGQLAPEEVYGDFLEGIQKGRSFFEVIKEKGRLSAEEIDKIIQTQNSSSDALGDILIKQGALERAQYDQILRDYAHEKPAPVEEVVPETSPEEKTSPEKTPEVSLSAAALESLKEVGGIDLSELEMPQENTDVTTESSAPAISSAALESLKEVKGVDESAVEELEEAKSEKRDSEEEKKSSPLDLDASILSALEDHCHKKGSEELANAQAEIDQVLHGAQGLPVVDTTEVAVEVTEDSEEQNADHGEEYLEFYNDSYQSNLYVVANRFRLKGRQKDLEELHEQFIELLKLAKNNNFAFQIKLLEPYENFMSLALNGSLGEYQGYQQTPAEALEILWEFRKIVAEGMPEGKLLADETWKAKYLNNLKSVMTVLKKAA